MDNIATPQDFTAEGILTAHTKTRWAILTPENPNSQLASETFNAHQRARFEALLDPQRYTLIPVKGSYGAVENAYVVLDISEENALRLGKHFGQESVITPNGLRFIETGRTLPIEAVVVDTTLQDFYTELPDGTRFAFVLAD